MDNEKDIAIAVESMWSSNTAIKVSTQPQSRSKRGRKPLKITPKERLHRIQGRQRRHRVTEHQRRARSKAALEKLQALLVSIVVVH